MADRPTPAAVRPPMTRRTFHVLLADPDGVIGECLEDNNTASGEASCLI